VVCVDPAMCECVWLMIVVYAVRMYVGWVMSMCVCVWVGVRGGGLNDHPSDILHGFTRVTV